VLAFLSDRPNPSLPENGIADRHNFSGKVDREQLRFALRSPLLGVANELAEAWTRSWPSLSTARKPAATNCCIVAPHGRRPGSPLRAHELTQPLTAIINHSMLQSEHWLRNRVSLIAQ
jgi:hypothetical protein